MLLGVAHAAESQAGDMIINARRTPEFRIEALRAAVPSAAPDGMKPIGLGLKGIDGFVGRERPIGIQGPFPDIACQVMDRTTGPLFVALGHAPHR